MKTLSWDKSLRILLLRALRQLRPITRWNQLIKTCFWRSSKHSSRSINKNANVKVRWCRSLQLLKIMAVQMSTKSMLQLQKRKFSQSSWSPRWQSLRGLPRQLVIFKVSFKIANFRDNNQCQSPTSNPYKACSSSFRNKAMNRQSIIQGLRWNITNWL